MTTTTVREPGDQETGARQPSPRRPAPAGTWTRESVVKAFQAEVKATGRLPSARSWSYSSDRHPNATRVFQLFGRWNALVHAAGFEPRPPVRTYELEWSDDDIIDHVQEWVLDHGKAPTADEWAWEASPNRPSQGTVRNRFGSWNAALRAAGLTPFIERGRQWTREEALATLQAEIRRTGRLPTVKEWQHQNLRPTVKVCRHLFGGWPSFQRAAGLDSRWTKRAVFEELDNWIEAHGYVPTVGDWRYADAEDGMPRWPTVRHMFGTWNAFMQEAGYLE